MSCIKPIRVSLTALAGLLVLMSFCLDAWAGVIAGRVVFSRGVCAALVDGTENATRLLGANAEIYEGDTIQTGTDSFIVIEFADKARITIRPNSSFRVQKYTTEGSTEAKLVLEKGGIKANMGEIAKAGSDKFQVETPLGSIKSQGADFNANLCDKECAEKAASSAGAKPDNSVARVVQAHGKVEALAADGTPRDLAVGQPLYEKERVRSQNDAYAVLVFRDGAKTTVQPGSELEITEFRYQPGDNANNRQWLKLIAGGVRALTGAIGKEHKENVQLATPVATIGIRGTIFYHHHLPAPLNGSPAGGYTHVNQGGVWHNNASGTSDLGAGKTGYFANFNSSQTVLASQPLFMQRFEQMTPSPADVHVEFSSLAPKATATLTVQAKGDGKVTVSDKQGGKTELGDKQSAKTTSDGASAPVSEGDDGGGDGPISGGSTAGSGGGVEGTTTTTTTDSDTSDSDDVDQVVPTGNTDGGGPGADAASGC